MPLLGAFILLIHLACAYHVFRSGRAYWWILVILGLPLMGCVIYGLLEVLPGMNERRATDGAGLAPAPDTALRRRIREMMRGGSVDDRMALARECTQHGLHHEAIGLYESCLRGSFANDGMLLFYLAQALVAGGDWDKATRILGQLKFNAPNMRPREVALLEARVLEGKREYDAALAAYKALIASHPDVEARYRYARLLQSRGMHAQAQRIFDEMLVLADRDSWPKGDEPQWTAAARGFAGEEDAQDRAPDDPSTTGKGFRPQSQGNS